MSTKLSLTTWLMEAEEEALSLGDWCLRQQSQQLDCSEESPAAAQRRAAGCYARCH